MAYDVRVRKLTTVRAGDLAPSPDNWRMHPASQVEALRAAMEEIGIVAPLIVREVDGHYQIVDGHLRAELDADQKVPVAIVDLDDDEARKVIATLDPIGAMAETDDELRRALLARVSGDNEAFEQYLEQCRREVTPTVPESSAPSEPVIGDNYLVTIELPPVLYEDFRRVLDPWRERDGVTVHVSTPN